jgi:hypothetical protein
VPLLVSVPWLLREGEGRDDESIIELVDLFPTIAGLFVRLTHIRCNGRVAVFDVGPILTVTDRYMMFVHTSPLWRSGIEGRQPPWQWRCEGGQSARYVGTAVVCSWWALRPSDGEDPRLDSGGWSVQAAIWASFWGPMRVRRIGPRRGNEWASPQPT